MSFLKLSTMEYPRYEGDIRLEYPDIPDDLTGDAFPIPSDYISVEQTEPPSYDNKTQYLRQTTPIENNGVWQSVWIVNTYTPEQLAQIEALNKPPEHKKRPPTTNSGSTPNVIT